MKFQPNWLIVIIFKLHIIYVSAQNYCDSTLCSGSRHIACRNTGVRFVCIRSDDLERIFRECATEWNKSIFSIYSYSTIRVLLIDIW